MPGLLARLSGGFGSLLGGWINPSPALSSSPVQNVRLDPGLLNGLFPPRPANLQRPEIVSDIVAVPYRDPFDLDNYGRETPEMRQNCREQAVKEPVVRAALRGKVNAIQALELSVIASDQKDQYSKDISEYVLWSLRGVPDGQSCEPIGWHRIAWNILMPSLIDGFSICEKTLKTVDNHPLRNRINPRTGTYYGPLWTIDTIRSLDTGFLRLELDVYRRVVAVVNILRGLEYFDPRQVVLHSHEPLYSNPFGYADMRAATRAANIIEDVYKVWYIALKIYGLPYMVGKVTDETKKAMMVNILEQLRAGGFAVTQKDDEIEVINLATAAGTNGFKDALQNFREDIFFAIRGVATPYMEGDGGQGAHGNAGVEKVTGDAGEYVLAEDLVSSVNQQIVPWLVGPNFGWDVAFPRAMLGGTNYGESKQLVDMIAAYQQTGGKVSRKWAAVTTRIGPPEDDEDELKPEQPQPQPGQPPVPEALPGQPPEAAQMPQDPGSGPIPEVPEQPPEEQFADDPDPISVAVDRLLEECRQGGRQLV